MIMRWKKLASKLQIIGNTPDKTKDVKDTIQYLENIVITNAIIILITKPINKVCFFSGIFYFTCANLISGFIGKS